MFIFPKIWRALFLETPVLKFALLPTNYMCQAQQTTSSLLKKQNQEREFEGNETDPVQIDIYVWVCQNWVPGHGKNREER